MPKTNLLFVASLGHFDVDFFSALVPILLAQLSRSFSLSNSQLGFAVLAYTLTAAFSQPVFGYLGDRIGGRRIAVGGIIWIAFWMAMTGFAPNYYLLVGALILAGLGSGAYHPQGVAQATTAVATKKGSGMSIFFLGGALGFTAGPIVGGVMLASLGPASMIIPALLSLIVAVLIWRTFPEGRPTKARVTAAAGSAVPWLAGVSLLTLAAILVSGGLRAGVNDSLNAYIPKFYLDQGLAPSQYGFIASTYLLGAAIGGLIGGFLSDRYNKKIIISTALLAAVPVLYAFVHSGPEVRLPLALMTGLLLSAPFTPALLMIQGIMPAERLSTVSGLAMAYFFAAGGVGTMLTGILADSNGLSWVLAMDVVVIAVAFLTSLLISSKAGEPARSPVPSPLPAD
jgi:MFS transporter, FSR family, fosmidomycin resistance protein